MKSILCFIICASLVFAFSMSASGDSLSEELGLPPMLGAKLLSEANLTPGKMLDEILEIYSPILGLSDVEKIVNVVYAINPEADVQKLFEHYGPKLSNKGWDIILRESEAGNLTTILFHEENGLLFIGIDPPIPNRQMTLMWILANVDPEKAANPLSALPAKSRTEDTRVFGPAGSLHGASRIPIGQPIAIPPSDKLHMKFTKSEINARFLDRNTAELRIPSHTNAGELIRVDQRLLLSFEPGIDIKELIMPGNIPTMLEVTDGLLRLSGGTLVEGPAMMDIVSKGAPVIMESFALVSGKHSVKSAGASVNLRLSAVRGGSLEIEVMGDNLTVSLPRDSSAKFSVSAPSGRIENMTDVTGEIISDILRFTMGAGKADINLRAINGIVCIKYAD